MIGFSAFAIFAAVISTNFYLKADDADNIFTTDGEPLHTGDYDEAGTLLDRGLEFLEYFIGTTALIGFLVAGIQFGISGGDPEKAKKAKMNMIYTSIGVILSVLALFLTRTGFSLFE